ncbi:MAG: hypothetical protein LUQ38_09295 [Methanotrichaceae archaeon]|nr:hypothetical protein [Methanotrichaceae archaeon]
MCDGRWVSIYISEHENSGISGSGTLLEYEEKWDGFLFSKYSTFLRKIQHSLSTIVNDLMAEKKK